MATEGLQDLYIWVDGIPLSRPKRNIARDFSDGVLTAEVIHHFYPRLVELHNYSAANGLAQKLYNWSTLNNRVFKRLGFVVGNSECEAIANCTPGAVERLLGVIHERLVRLEAQASSPAARINTEENPGEGLGYALEEFRADYERGNAIAAHNPEQESSKAGQPSRAPVSDQRESKAPLSAGLAQLRLHEPVDKHAAAALAERDLNIASLRETNEILDIKVRKLEQLVRLKDAKLQKLSMRLEALTAV